MKKLFISTLILLSLFYSAQQEENRFSQSENEASQAVNPNTTASAESTGNTGGNPGDPVPINENLQILILIAGGIILAVEYHRKISPIKSFSKK